MLPWRICLLQRFGVLSEFLALDSVYLVHVDGIVESVYIDAWAALQVCLHRLGPVIAKDTSIHWTILKLIEWLSNRRRYGRSSIMSSIAASLGDVYMYADNLHTTASMICDTDSFDKKSLLIKCATVLTRSCKGMPISNEQVRRIVDTPLFAACVRSTTTNHAIGALLEALLQISLFAGVVVGAHLIYRGVPIPRRIAVHVDRLIVQSVLYTGSISRSMCELGGAGSVYGGISQRVQDAISLRRRTIEVSCTYTRIC